MRSAIEILLQIEGLSKRLLEMIEEDKAEGIDELLSQRKLLIASLGEAKSSDMNLEKTILHRIEKCETKMLDILQTGSKALKDSIETVSKGKKAVKDGYFKSQDAYDKNTKFSKRG